MVDLSIAIFLPGAPRADTVPMVPSTFQGPRWDPGTPGISPLQADARFDQLLLLLILRSDTGNWGVFDPVETGVPSGKLT